MESCFHVDLSQKAEKQDGFLLIQELLASQVISASQVNKVRQRKEWSRLLLLLLVCVTWAPKPTLPVKQNVWSSRRKKGHRETLAGASLP